MKLLSIVFSFRNEEKNLEELVNRISSALKKINDWKYEIIFVNDDSTDTSEKILTNLQKTANIKIINMSRRFGRSPCVLAGLNEASGDAAIYMDTDLQDPPELIPELIKKYEEGFDVVHTKRKKRLGENALKMLVTKAAYKLISIFSTIPLQTNAGDFKLLSRRVLNCIKNIKEVDPFLRGVSVWIGFKQEYVEYVREKRFSGETHYPLFGSGPIKEFIRGITSYSAGPLYFGIFIGLFSIIFSIFLILFAFYEKFSGSAVPGSSGVIISIAFFSGTILISIGLVGLYIARIYEQLQGRPRYIIKEIIEPPKGQK